MSKAICRVAECDSPADSRHLCGKHLQRLNRLGTTDLTPRPNLSERFWVKVNKDAPISAVRPDLGHCWLWTASLDGKGYGKIGVKGKLLQAHRLSYEMVLGAIPDGLVLDHLCRIRHCVNPGHLEPVTQRVNLLRGQTLTAKEVQVTHCPQDHPYDEANTYQYGNNRKCRACRREHRMAFDERQRRKRAGLAA